MNPFTDEVIRAMTPHRDEHTWMCYDYLSEDDYKEFQQFLIDQPEAGNIVQGSGGVRVCYYTRNTTDQILLLVIYAKSVRSSIPGAVLKKIKEVLDHDD